MPRTTTRTEPNGAAAAKMAVEPRMEDGDYENLSIWQAMEKMTTDDWSDKLLYIYRLKPMSVNKMTGDHNYIDKRMESIDQEQLKAMYGGGTFQLILNKTNPTRTLIKAQVKIPGDPILRADETLVTPPDSKAEAATVVHQGTNVDDTIKLIHAMKSVVAKSGRRMIHRPRHSARPWTWLRKARKKGWRFPRSRPATRVCQSKRSLTWRSRRASRKKIRC